MEHPPGDDRRTQVEGEAHKLAPIDTLLAAHGVDLVLSHDTEAARRHALDRGLIVPAALPRR